MTTRTTTITGLRNGKAVTIRVDVTETSHATRWVKREGGKPLFGTTGYWKAGATTIGTYRGGILMTDVREMA